ncbi:hypothetical protein JCM11641_004985 [Rhodosporidiobolus odoratus]
MTRTEYRIPPLRYLVPAALSFLVLLHFLATSQSESYAATANRVKGLVGLGSDGMPVSWSEASTASKGSTAAKGDQGRTNTAAANQWDKLTAVAGEEKNSTLASAAFAFLARNSDVWEVASAMQSLLDRCPACRQYPWVFLNNEPFSDEFKRVTSSLSSQAPCQYGLVPKEHWEEPSWIDEKKASEERKKMADAGVIYGDSKTYRRMCRYQSGWFFRHELLKDYEFYWRIDPAVKFYCDIPYDPFKEMETNGWKYGFTVSLYEYEATIPTLWDSTKEFISAHPEHLAKPNSLNWVSNDKGETYNRCHFWSNFEIGSLNFLRSKAYMDYFEHLDKSGGFSYERWGDAPVHTIAAALFLKPEEVHYFKDIGYFHNPFLNCPVDQAILSERRCSCDPKHKDNFYDHWYSCSNKWRELNPN